MSTNLINIGLIFKNRIGIVSSITKSIFQNQGNIKHSSMVKLGDHFAFDLSADFPEGTDSKIVFKNVESAKKMKVIDDNYKAKAKLSCSDNPGIIHSTAEALEKLQADITQLNSHVTRAPFSSMELFNMEVEFHVDRGINKGSIREALEKIVEKYDCDLEIK